jgi:hypothetical protein
MNSDPDDDKIVLLACDERILLDPSPADDGENER